MKLLSAKLLGINAIHASRQGLRSDALLLIAHGSARYRDVGGAILAHAGTIRAQGCLAEVAVGFLSGTPTVAEALVGIGAAVVHVVPFFMEDGHFTQVAVPKALRDCAGLYLHPVMAGPDPTSSDEFGSRRALHPGFAPIAGDGRVKPDHDRKGGWYYPPIGTHPGMMDLIRQRIAGRTISDTILIGHGSSKSPGRRSALHTHAEALGARVAFLEEPPFLADALAKAKGPAIGVLGIFAGDGGHVRDDLPALIAAARERYGERLIDLGTIGDDPGMVKLILDVVTGS